MLDRYLHQQAAQDMKRKLSACFVLEQVETFEIKGYYTLSNSSVPLDGLPENLKRRLPPAYKAIPTTLIGRLAVDSRNMGQGLGRLLLVDALKRSWLFSLHIGSYAVVVDPVDEEAAKFYQKYGFILLPDSGKMLLPMSTVKRLFS